MGNIWSVFKREFKSYFSSPIAYVIIVIFLLIAGSFAFWIGKLLQSNDASLTYSFFFYLPWFFVVLAPAVAMRLWSDEHRQGTTELLMTLPTSPWHAIVGKYLAACFVWFLCLALTFPVWSTISYLTAPDYEGSGIMYYVMFPVKLVTGTLEDGVDHGAAFSGYVGAFLYAAACLAVTLAVSAFTRSQVTCLIISVAICLALTLIGHPMITEEIDRFMPVEAVETVAAFSFMTPFLEMTKGVIEFAHVFQFGSVILVCLLITNIAIRSKRA